MEAAPGHTARSFQPWQGPVSTAASQDHCLLGPNDDDSSLGADLSHFPSPDQACPPAGYTPSASDCLDIIADIIFHLIFSILQPREAIASLVSVQPFSCLPSGMPRNCTHTEAHTEYQEPEAQNSAPKRPCLASHPKERVRSLERSQNPAEERPYKEVRTSPPVTERPVWAACCLLQSPL